MRPLVALALLICARMTAQEDASSVALNGVGDVIRVEPRVGSYNPAALADTRDLSVRVSAVPSPFGVPALGRGGFAAAFKAANIGWALSATGLRAGLSKRVGVRLGAGYRVWEDVGVGVDCEGAVWTFPRYRSIGEFALGVGALVRTGPSMSGLILRMTLQQGRPIAREDMAVGIGCSFDATEAVSVSAECVQEPIVPLSIRCAVTVRPIERAVGVLSWADVPGTIGGGVGWKGAPWELFFGAQWHPVLGWTQALDLSVRWE